ncbi:transglutaminase-like domain-containing protein [Muricauda sp. ANG21]|uniref:transglutaminase-like domain-containing protein n=1 Tax=Allomuricauda sp. ANG21 TaxID=3042468 RepID=UPI0034562932
MNDIRRFRREKGMVFSLILILVLGCENKTVTYEWLKVSTNLEYVPNTEFRSFEDLNDPRFEHLKEKYQLDTIFKGEESEFERILLLRHWIKSVIKIEDHNPSYPGGGYAESILDNALKGNGFHCAHFMRVQNAIMNSYGYVTRTINAGPGAKGGPDGNHGVNEIWSNEYGKWFLSDSKYDHHFEKNGIPLSALEVRNEFIKNNGVDMDLMKGPGRISIEFDEEIGRTKEEFAQTYTWVQFYVFGNRHTVHPAKYTNALMVYQDDYFNSNTYYRDGVPVSQEKLDWFIKVKDEKKIEWTPNVLDIDIKIRKDTLHIIIDSTTPNLREYQIKDSMEGRWRSIKAQSTLNLTKEKHIWFLRSLNIANVTGPEYKLVVQHFDSELN